MSKNTPKIIFSLFGPPGSGKGTLSERLSRELNFAVLSTGNLCRQHVANKSRLGLLLEGYLNRGQLIPDALITDMVKEWLLEKTEQSLPIVLDGFPRTSGQATALLEDLVRLAPGYSFKVVFIELASEEIVKRLGQRLVCSNKACQAVFKDSDKIESCSYCQSVLVKRADDKEDVVRERLRLYPEYREALVEMYKVLKQPVVTLDVAGMTPEQVFAAFCELL
jgi:adenylate kinase